MTWLVVSNLLLQCLNPLRISTLPLRNYPSQARPGSKSDWFHHQPLSQGVNKISISHPPPPRSKMSLLIFSQFSSIARKLFLFLLNIPGESIYNLGRCLSSSHQDRFIIGSGSRLNLIWYRSGMLRSIYCLDNPFDSKFLRCLSLERDSAAEM